MTSRTTPMMRQYLEIKAKHRDAILLYRMGDFYEMFFEDAEEAAPILQIALTSRDGKVPMCGIPHHALDTYLIRLIKAGRRVAVCEQVEDPSKSKGLVRREVVRILTPGCIPDGVGVDEGDAHLLASARDGWIAQFDVTTGSLDFYPLEAAEFSDHLAVHPVKEILVDNDSFGGKMESISTPVTPLDTSYFDPTPGARRLEQALDIRTLKGYGLQERDSRAGLAGALLRYVEETQMREKALVHDVTIHAEASLVDSTTLRNLEIFQSSLGDPTHSLHAILNRCVTPIGSRLMRRWMREPLKRIADIHGRLLGVETFHRSPQQIRELRDRLKDVGDLERSATKIDYSRENPRDHTNLCMGLLVAQEIRDLLVSCGTEPTDRIANGIDIPLDIVRYVLSTLVEAPPLTTREGGMIRDGVDRELDDVRAVQRDSRGMIAALEEEERKRTQIPNLKVGYNRVFGYYLEVSRAHSDKVPEDYIRKQTLVNAERYVTPAIKELEEKILNAQETIVRIEERIYSELRSRVRSVVPSILSASRSIAELDCLTTLALVARDRGYVRPEIHEGDTLDIEGGRHPVIEKLLAEEPFTPNDCRLERGGNFIQIITGPNMGGKSTYLRQVALIAYMAHMGSFVPASRASLPLLDRIFTRVGAFDQLTQGESTFMVEMLELAQILRQASGKSLVILDEVGRGTSTFDGLSIAWAAVEYLHQRCGAMTLFATHYHELTELALLFDGIENYALEVKEFQGQIYFLHRIRHGSADRSYGIEVAQLAGVPKDVVSRARETLSSLEKSELDPHGIPRAAGGETGDKPRQLTLFPGTREIVLERLRAVDTDRMTPMEALNLLAELAEMADS